MLAAGLLARKAVERGLRRQAVGEDVAGARARRSSSTTTSGPGSCPTSRSSASTSSASAARPASATRARCRPRSPRPSTRATCRWPRCCRATATSRAASTPTCGMNYLASPPLVVAYALAGTMDIDLYTEPLGTAPTAQPVYLRDIWPTSAEVAAVVAERGAVGDVHASATPPSAKATSGGGPARARPATASRGTPTSTYVRRPPFFDGMAAEPTPLDRHRRRPGARRARRQRHHRPHLAGRRHPRPTARPGGGCSEHGVGPADFNSYGVPPGQPRGDDPGHVRQHPPAQPAGAAAPRAASPCTCPTASR